MKRFKKLLAFAVSCTMIFGTMSMMSFAQPTDPSQEMNKVSYDGYIEITGLEEKDEVKLYKVLEWAGSRPTDQSEDEYKKQVYGGWRFTDSFFGKGNQLKDENEHPFENDAAAIAAIVGDPKKVDPKLTSLIAGELARLAGSPIDTKKLTGKTYTYNIDAGTKVGLYMALITPADQKTVYNPVFVSADFNATGDPNTSSWKVTPESSYYLRSAAKKSTTGSDKKAEVDAGTSYDPTWTSARPGEIVKYTVEFTIPGYGDIYQEPTFNITDKMDGMELATKPEITEPAGLTAVTDYVLTGDAGDTQFTIEFKPAYLKTVHVPTKVVVKYDGVILDGDNVNVDQEKNEIWTEYSHDPQNPNDFDVKKDVTTHYTYTIDANAIAGSSELMKVSGAEIVKVGVDAHGNPIVSEKISSKITDENYYQSPLAGATFKLYTNKDCTTPYERIKEDGTKEELPEVTSGDDGRITITGLDAGTYWLLETKAPSGYIKVTDPVKIDIVPHFSTSKVTEYYQNGNWSETKPESGDYKEATYDVETLDSYEVRYNDSPAATFTYNNEGTTVIKISEKKEIPTSITNTKGVELPATGGMGTTIFYVIGAVLVLGAGILLVTRRRMNIQ